jgi:tRNA(adenine34) deaminase
MLSIHSDEYFMDQALKEAKKAEMAGEVPVGAIIVWNKQIIARAHNQVELLNDITAHAEVLAITAAAVHFNAKYLNDCTLYVTLEPCVMCAGALYWSQIDRIVFGAADEKRGFMRFGKELVHPKTKIEYGVHHEKCAEIIKNFFAEKR